MILQGNLLAIIDEVYELNMDEMGRLYSQAQHLSRLVDDLHELARAEAHELTLLMRKSDLGSLVASSAESYRSVTLEHGIGLSLVVPDEPLVYNADPERIRQVIDNLMGNAIRYTPQGGSIEVALIDSAESINITISDSGIGISAEHLPHIFDRFYRADPSRNRSVKGTGLGLAIAQAIVEAHDGELIADSEGTDLGSTFTIVLPKMISAETSPKGIAETA